MAKKKPVPVDEDAAFREEMADADGRSAAALSSHLMRLGNQLAEKNGWEISGMKAVYFYLMNRYHWLPRDVRSMTLRDLAFAVSDVTVVPPKRRFALPGDAK